MMDCPGEYLKRERVLREVSLDDISRDIKVPVKLLKALEADDYQALPHATFVKGFIRAYCKFLGVDENDALLRFELYLQEIAEFEEPAKKAQPLDVRERSYPVRRFLTLALVAAGIIIIAGFYYFSSSTDDSVEAGKLSSVESVKEDAPSGAEETGDKVVVKRKVAKPVIKRKEQRVEKSKEVSSPKLESVVESPRALEASVEKKAPMPFVISPSLSSEELFSIALAPGEHLLRAHAKELTWMRIEIDSRAPFEVMLQPGERAEWKGKVFFCS